MLQNTINQVNRWAKALNSPDFIAVSYEDDWTIIPVTIKQNNVTLYTVEDGIKTECNHVYTERFDNNL